MTTTSSCRTGERGFTLIEVLVAVLMISIVAGAATMAIASSTRSGQHVKIADRQKAIASGVLNRALANRDWIKANSCVKVGPCTINGFVGAEDPLLREPEGSVKHSVAVTAVGVDLPNDGIGAADADRQVPDVYRIRVTVTTQAPETAGRFQPYSIDGSLNMAVRARTGTMRLRACSVTPQIDDRIGLGLCTTLGTQSMVIQPPGAGATNYCPTTVTIAAATPECGAWRQAITAATPGSAAVTRMTVAPLSMQFTLSGPKSAPAASQITRSVTTNTTGAVEVTQLEPGRYDLKPVSTTSWELWSSHSVPSGGEVTIEAGEVNDAVQVFRPAARPATIYLTHLDVTDPANITTKQGAVLKRAIKLVPVPGGRSALATGQSLGWTTIAPGARSVTINGVTPGLYQFSMLEFPGVDKDILLRTGATTALRYIWIPPVAGSTAVRTQVPARLEIRDIYCLQSQRTVLYNARITAQQKALGQAPHGFVWTKGAKEYWHDPKCPDPNSFTGSVETTGMAGA